MSRKWITPVTAGILSLTAMGLLAGCPPNAYHVITLMVTPITGGTIRVTPDKATYFAGTEVSLEAIPNEGYIFQRWVGTGMNTTINPTQKRIYADETIVAEFALARQDPVIEGEGESGTEGEVVKNGDFEAASENWTSVSLTGMAIICDQNICTDIDGMTSNGGAYWAWFGNDALFNYENATLFQEITLPSREEVYLTFDMAIPKAEIPFTLSVLFNGEVIFEATDEEALLFNTYQPVTLDISDFADGRTVVLTFLYESHAALLVSSDTSAVFVDNISIK